MTPWTDLPGLTAVSGQARLPHRPADALGVLQAVLEGAHLPDRSLAGLTSHALRTVPTDRARIEGLIAWLPLSRVAEFAPDGQLNLDGQTDLVDLSMRLAAWFGSQPVDEDVQPAQREYVRTLIQLAVDAVLQGSSPRLPKPYEVKNKHREPVAPEHVADPFATQLTRLLSALDEAFLERRLHVRASLLALLAGQHVLLLGPPGTAKSQLARALCACFADANYFEYLLSRFTHPDELFGPVSIPGLKEEDYRRITEGFLPTAHIAFLDEIFKANSAILNSLLTLINERAFHHGRHRDAVPLVGMIGASNELPDPDGGLEALYDRFLVRLAVPPLSAPESFLRVASGNAGVLRLSPADTLHAPALEALRARAKQVAVPEDVAASLVSLWRRAHELEWGVSDRRWRQAVSLLQVGAASAGRTSLTWLDLLLLEPVLAPTPDRAPEVREALLALLARGSVPTHDLRAQWALLGWDRVASAPGDRYERLGSSQSFPWRQRLPLRRRNVARFLSHHREAVQRLAADRAGIEQQAAAHPWVESLPTAVLGRHLEAARDLSRWLKLAERLQASLQSPISLAEATLEALPEAQARTYGRAAVFTVEIAETGKTANLTLSGEREPGLPTSSNNPGAPRTTLHNMPLGQPATLKLSAEQWLDLLDGALDPEQTLRALPASLGRNAHVVLGAVRKHLGGSALPPPPPAPQ